MAKERRIRKVLIANRGEIAVRIQRTLREMGIRSVAVYSEADRHSLHAALADEALEIGPAPAAESYLDIGRLLDAAKRSGADAVHPGYGFLSENPEFAAAVSGAGLVFVGPPAAAIRALGNKLNSRALARAHGIPVVAAAEDLSDREVLRRRAREIGYPVLIKAAAGGGGKGMRVVTAEAELLPRLESAQREAQKAFGSDQVFLEKYLERPRHIEFQVLADERGEVLHLNERECSIQRHHQKIIEESPSPAVTPALRAQMGCAAVTLAKAAGYVNAGTVEFMLDQTGHFYLLEMNTRLQVEHPVTEMTLGLDLVAEQVRIAEGRPLRWAQAPQPRGHAVECRLYAEDPAEDFRPCPGRVEWLHEPAGPWLRNDCGVRTGSEVSSFYDPLISKLIAWGIDRDSALARLRRALRDYAILGLGTNREYLLDILSLAPFERGELHTGLLDEQLAGWQPRRRQARTALIAAAVLLGRMSAAPDRAPAPPDPWLALGPWGR